jgi:intracellular multiplication protein IcmJ
MYIARLAINPSGWHVFNARKADSAFRAFAEKVFARDQHTCQYCGFQAKLHQEVVNLDGNYRNNKMGNMATACPFCTQCQFLDAVGSVFGGGKLIYLPEMSQAELNSFCHVLFCAMMNKTGYLDSAQTAYRNFRMRTQPIEKKYGQDTSSPNTLCQLMINSNAYDSKTQNKVFKSLRLLPSYAKFKKQLEDWAKAAVEELSQD